MSAWQLSENGCVMGRGRWTQSPLCPHLPELFRQLVTARAARATGPVGGSRGQSPSMCTAHCLGIQRTGSLKIAHMLTDDGLNTFWLSPQNRVKWLRCVVWKQLYNLRRLWKSWYSIDSKKDCIEIWAINYLSDWIYSIFSSNIWCWWGRCLNTMVGAVLTSENSFELQIQTQLWLKGSICLGSACFLSSQCQYAFSPTDENY